MADNQYAAALIRLLYKSHVVERTSFHLHTFTQ
jgi:hypothetical protein